MDCEQILIITLLHALHVPSLTWILGVFDLNASLSFIKTCTVLPAEHWKHSLHPNEQRVNQVFFSVKGTCYFGQGGWASFFLLAFTVIEKILPFSYSFVCLSYCYVTDKLAIQRKKERKKEKERKIFFYIFFPVVDFFCQIFIHVFHQNFCWMLVWLVRFGFPVLF